MASPVIPHAAKAADAGRRIKSGGCEYVCAYHDAGASLSPASSLAGAVLVLSYDTGDGTLCPILIAPVKLAVYQYVAVAREAIAVAGWYWVQVEGACSALLDGTTDVGVGDYLQLYETNANMILDSATTISTHSCANALEARTANTVGLQSVFLLGNRVIIDGA